MKLKMDIKAAGNKVILWVYLNIKWGQKHIVCEDKNYFVYAVYESTANVPP